MKTLKFRKRNLLYILLVCVMCIGCNKKVSCELEIEVKTTTFCERGMYGKVGEGSCLYKYEEAKKGYVIIATRCGEVQKTVYAYEKDIQKIIDDIRYKEIGVDSVANSYNSREGNAH